MNLELSTDDSPAADACLEELRADFAAWTATAAERSPTGTISVRLCSTPFETVDRFGPVLFKTKMASVRGLGPRRLVQYDRESAATLDASTPLHPTLEIHAPDRDLLREVAYTACLSLLGDVLDQQGFHRVHGLGISVAGRGVLCVFGEKSGKSTLAMALRLAAAPDLLFHSDETPLLNHGSLHPYPNRLALGEVAVKVFGDRLPTERRVFHRKLFGRKELFAFEPTEIAPTTAIRALLVDGGRGHAKAAIEPCSRARGFLALADAMVVGRGVTQMAEFFLRLDRRNLVSLSGIALSRAREAAGVTLSAGSHVFRRCDDPDENARTLLEFAHGL